MSLNSIPHPLTYHCISVILWRLRYARNQTAAWDHILTHRRGNTLKVVIVWHMIIRLPVSADASLRSCVRAMTPIYREPNGVTRLRPFLPPTASYPSPVMGKQCQDQFLHGRVKLLSNFLSNHGSIVLKKLPLSFVVCYGCLSLSLSRCSASERGMSRLIFLPGTSLSTFHLVPSLFLLCVICCLPSIEQQWWKPYNFGGFSIWTVQQILLKNWKIKLDLSHMTDSTALILRGPACFARLGPGRPQSTCFFFVRRGFCRCPGRLVCLFFFLH